METVSGKTGCLPEDSLSLFSAPKRGGVSKRKNGGLCGGTMWRDFELINCPTSTKNIP